MAQTGKCRCGAVRYSAEGAPAHSALCWCADCRASAGAPMVQWTLFDVGAVTIEGEPVRYESSPGTFREFCGTCGTGLFFYNEAIFPGQVDIQGATFDDADAFAPQAHIQTADAPRWREGGGGPAPVRTLSRAMTDPIARWHEFVELGEPALLDALIAEDAVFRSPAVHSAQHGKAITVKYLAAAMRVLNVPEFRYTGEWRAERSAVLEFESVVGGMQVNGVDIIAWDDDGQIASFKVMVRPLKGLHALVEAMGAELAR